MTNCTVYKNNTILEVISNNNPAIALSDALNLFYESVKRFVKLDEFKEDVKLYLSHSCTEEYGAGLAYTDPDLGYDYYLSFEIVKYGNAEALEARLVKDEEAKAKNAEIKKAYRKAKKATKAVTIANKLRMAN